MTNEELQEIKDEFQSKKALLREQRELNEILDTRKDLYRNLQEIAWRLETVDDELFQIQDEEDIYRHLSDYSEFEHFKCGLDKQLYFFYGYMREDKVNGEEWDGKKVSFVPRNTKFSPFVKYYALYWDLVDSRGYKLVPIKDMKSFESKNHIIDTGEDIKAPYINYKEYNMIRQFGGPDDCIEKSFEDYRTELFKYFVHSDTEEEAINKLLLKHSK